MTEDDLPAVEAWVSLPHVARWWTPGTTPQQEATKYRHRINGTSPRATTMLTVTWAGAAIGWCQWYRWADYPAEAGAIGARDGELGIDYAIGDPDWIGRGIGTQLVAALVTGAPPPPAWRRGTHDPRGGEHGVPAGPREERLPTGGGPPGGHRAHGRSTGHLPAGRNLRSVVTHGRSGSVRISPAVWLDLAVVVRARSRRCHAVRPGGTQRGSRTPRLGQPSPGCCGGRCSNRHCHCQGSGPAGGVDAVYRIGPSDLRRRSQHGDDWPEMTDCRVDI